MVEAKTEEPCCPKFNPEPWAGRLHEWNRRIFIKDKVFTLFYLPLNFGSVMKRLNEKVEKAGAEVPDGLCLSDHTSKWNMDLYLSVDRPVAEAENTDFSGKFLTKVYEGDFKNTGKWCKDFETYAEREGCEIIKEYMWYTTCPKCAKKYGKNFVVVAAEVR